MDPKIRSYLLTSIFGFQLQEVQSIVFASFFNPEVLKSGSVKGVISLEGVGWSNGQTTESFSMAANVELVHAILRFRVSKIARRHVIQSCWIRSRTRDTLLSQRKTVKSLSFLLELRKLMTSAFIIQHEALPLYEGTNDF